MGRTPGPGNVHWHWSRGKLSQPGEVQTHKEPEEQNPETDRGDAWEEPDITPHPDPGQHSQHQQDSGCMEQSQTNQHIFCQKKIFPHWENKDHKKNKKIGKIRNLQWPKLFPWKSNAIGLET